MKRFVFAGTLISCVLISWAYGRHHNAGKNPHNKIRKVHRLIEKVNSGKMSVEDAQNRCGSILKIVHLSGKVFNFAPHIIPPDAPVEDVLISIAEFPLTKVLNIRSDVNGYWSMPVIKIKNIPLYLSLRFEKEGFVTTQSNQLKVTDAGIDSIALQYPSVEYYTAAITLLEQQVSEAIGAPYTVQTLAVATVGKSWASMFFNQFPHGDPGATVTIDPPISFPALGPIYFNDDVVPDPAQPYVSTDGGVLYANVPTGTYTLQAYKDPFEYETVTFTINPDVELYIASPPHSLQGNNDSGPGEW